MDPTIEGQIDEPKRRSARRWEWFRSLWLPFSRGRVPYDSWRRILLFLPTRSPSRPTPTSRLLFLDDDPLRAEIFLKQNPGATWVKTVAQCLAHLEEPWDEVHLDHDLGGKRYVDSNAVDCGMEVIRWLSKEPRNHLKDARFLVHTHHAAAGLLMVLQMRRCDYKAEFRPFGLDLERMLAHNEPAGDEGQDDRDSEIQPPPRTRSS